MLGIINTFTNWFKKPKTEQPITKRETKIQFTVVEDGSGYKLSCDCPPGEEKKFAELCLFVCMPTIGKTIFETVQTKISQESLQKIKEEFGALTKLVGHVIESSDENTPLVKPSHLFGKVFDDDRLK